jgi:hypothetical protein
MLMLPSEKLSASPIGYLKYYFPNLPDYGVVEQLLAQMEPILLE